MEQGSILVRPVRFRDAPGLEAFYARLSPESRARRFLGASRGISREQALRFALAGTRGSDGFVALERATGRIVGHLCLAPLRPGVEEVGVAVEDDLQRKGIGRTLLRAAVTSARRRGIDTLEARMLGSNPGIHRLLEHAGIPWRRRPADAGSELLVMDLAAAAIG
jgi:GNAT superfamily N-acetyltransferase